MYTVLTLNRLSSNWSSVAEVLLQLLATKNPVHSHKENSVAQINQIGIKGALPIIVPKRGIPKHFFFYFKLILGDLDVWQITLFIPMKFQQVPHNKIPNAIYW